VIVTVDGAVVLEADQVKSAKGFTSFEHAAKRSEQSKSESRVFIFQVLY
jgi:hypothetical protein